MKRSFYALALVVTFAFTAVYLSSTGCGPDDSEDVPVFIGITSDWSIPPLDITGLKQSDADSFSWRTFIAMNWPANPATCQADTANGRSILQGGGPVVWETYLSSDQIFVDPKKGTPAAWCANSNAETAMQHVPAEVQELSRKTGITRFIHMDAKSPVDSIHGIDQASGGPLVDQNKRYARYEIRVNKVEYDYIKNNSLWSVEGQTNFLNAGDVIDFPSGSATNQDSIGSMEFKAAWKVLGPNDDSTKFYCIRAIVYNDDHGTLSPGPNPVTLGLVGLHIAHKTHIQRFWVWSTFEHVDNLTKSFSNPACDTCTPNQQITGSPEELDSNGNPLHRPTQVKRVNKVVQQDTLGPINDYFQGLLKGSVWANYELIGTQWLQFEDVVPTFLANSVQETYLQGPHPDSVGFDYHPKFTDDYYFTHKAYNPFSIWTSSSCLACHYTSYVILEGDTVKTDFSFLLGDAQ